ncbi:MAG: twin-arginine translocase TatA/TatE family subunit [Myxococcota bacterium]|nr:twin-arginine translocase TatA/TatE family subunit [Myxococcota bacterium]
MRLAPHAKIPMGNVGVTEILLIALVALLLFGAGRIADIGKGLGQGIKNFKQGLKEAEELDADKKPADAQLTDGKDKDTKVPTVKQA